MKKYNSFTEELLENEQSPKFCSFIQNDHDYIKARRIRLEVHNYRWIEGEKGRQLSWHEALTEWRSKYQGKFDEWYDNNYNSIEFFNRPIVYDGNLVADPESTLQAIKELFKMLPKKHRGLIKKLLQKNEQTN